MKRRSAIKNIVFVSAGIGLLHSCNWDTHAIPVYENLALDDKAWKFINEVSNQILPISLSDNAFEASPTHFVLNSINDCFSPKEIKKFLDGHTAFQTIYHKEYGEEIEVTQLKALIDKMLFVDEEEEKKAIIEKKLPEPEVYFLSTIKSLRLRLFKSEENFLKNNLAYEFVPARFVGCMPINSL